MTWHKGVFRNYKSSLPTVIVKEYSRTKDINPSVGPVPITLFSHLLQYRQCLPSPSLSVITPYWILQAFPPCTLGRCVFLILHNLPLCVTLADFLHCCKSHTISRKRKKKVEKIFREIVKVEILFKRIWGRREKSACEDKCSCLSVIFRFRSIS